MAHAAHITNGYFCILNYYEVEKDITKGLPLDNNGTLLSVAGGLTVFLDPGELHALKSGGEIDQVYNYLVFTITDLDYR